MITANVSLLPRDRATLAVFDYGCVLGALLASAALRLGYGAGLAYVHERSPHVVAVSSLFPLVFYVFGLYDARRLAAPIRVLVPAAVSTAVTLLLAGAYWYAAAAPPVGRGIVIEFGLLVFASAVAARFAYAKIRGVLKIRALVVGPRELAASVRALMRAHPDCRMTVVGVVHWSPENGDERHRDRSADYRVLGGLGALEELVATHHVDRLVVPSALGHCPELLRRLRPLRYRGVELVDYVTLHEELAREIPLDHVDDDWLLKAATMSSRMHIRRLKRLTDVAVSLVLLVPATPVLLAAALAVKLTSRGPVLFRQERAGLGARPFMVLKLRTMYENAEELTGPVWSTDDDPRITPVGKLLRKFRIDELPQLWNVLRGEMSLVGPRPERPVFVQTLSANIPFYSERLLVRPGITGWAQVTAPYAASVADSARKLQFDLYYTKNLSFSLDLLIFLMTARTVLFGREREQGGLKAGHQLGHVPVANSAVSGDLAAAAEAVAYADGERDQGKIARA